MMVCGQVDAHQLELERTQETIAISTQEVAELKEAVSSAKQRLHAQGCEAQVRQRMAKDKVRRRLKLHCDRYAVRRSCWSKRTDSIESAGFEGC